MTNAQKKPWAPPVLLPDPVKTLGLSNMYRYKWGCQADIDMMKNNSSGWEVVTDVKPNGTMKVRELILLRMPRETAEARAEYYRNRAMQQSASVGKLTTGSTNLEKYKTSGGAFSDTDEAILGEDAMELGRKK